MVRVPSTPQSRSKAVVCISTPRMYPRSGYSLVTIILNLWITRKYLLRGYFLGVLTHTQLLGTDSGEVMELWPCGFKIEYTHLGFASAGAVWLGIWNSDHVVLKSIIRTSASPRQQQSHWGLMMTQDAYFSFLTHAKQLLLVTFCETTAGNRKKWKCDVRTYGRTEGQTDVKSEIVI